VIGSGDLVRGRKQAPEKGLIGDKMIGCQHCHYRARLAPLKDSGCQSYNRSRAARLRFEQEILLWYCGGLCLQSGRLLSGSDDQDPLGRKKTGKPGHCHLEHAFCTTEVEHLLGAGLARERPKASSPAASHYHGIIIIVHG
jgi:hypothetical protein